MFVENLCSPAILYLGFALTQIIIDLFRKMYNTAIIKTAVAIVFTTILNMLCSRGLSVISWFIVFIPFVTMTLVTGILLYVFGLAPFTGKLDYSQQGATTKVQQPKNPAFDRDAIIEEVVQPPVEPSCPTMVEKKMTSMPTPPATTSSSTPTETSATTSGELAMHAAGIRSRLGNVVGDLGKGLGNAIGDVRKGVETGVSEIGNGVSDMGTGLKVAFV